uniref:Uncharacterized protein n=1 Tax=Lepeophtheirus salmonis TaxID=72036 RepID=A0A0K2UUT5_LEPSM
MKCKERNKETYHPSSTSLPLKLLPKSTQFRLLIFLEKTLSLI